MMAGVVLVLVVAITVTVVLVVAVVVMVLEEGRALLLLVVAVVVACVIRTLSCAGVLLDTLVEVLAVDMRVEVLIIVSDVAVDLLMDALAGIARAMLTDVGIGVLVGMNASVFADVTVAFEFEIPGPSKECCC